MARYEISTDVDCLDFDIIHRFLADESYWARGIPRATPERAIGNSLCFGVYRGEEQVGFARVVTDKATFALLSDLFILPGHRGRGLSKALTRRIVDHDLQGLRRLLLLTTDAQELYRQFGFEELTNVWRFMEVLQQDPYGASLPG
ncbi:MAG: GNAT family N-acetyltransferase [Salinisphaera sp.]